MLTALAAAVSGASVRADADDDPWHSLADQIFDKRSTADGAGVLALDAPYRAEDAAVVPVGIHNLLPTGDLRRISAITLVIDQNPSPVAARFTLGAASGIRSISTRVRVDSYTNIHAVAEMDDGALLAVARFVKAAGGCSAPAAKQEASGDGIPLGTMRFRQLTQPGADRPEMQVLVRHPNYSGMQMDQVTRLYVPAHFVSRIRIWQGEDMLLDVDSGISIAENPQIRFDYRSNGTTAFRAEAQDNEGGIFKQSWSVARA